MSKKEKLLVSAQKNLQKGQVAKAIKDYQQILQIDSGDVRSRQKLAELLGRDRRTGEAIGEYETVAKHYSKTGFYLKAIAVYKQMQKLDSSKVEIYHHLAELNEKQGLVGNALAEYRNLAAHYEKQKMYTEAASVLQKMQELEPENLNIQVKIAETYAKGGLKDRAREEFELALTILRQKEDFSRLLKLYEIFLPLYPDRPEMRAGMAQALIQKGDADKGMQILRNLLQDDPEKPEILSILAQGYRKLEDYANERLTYQHLLRNCAGDLDLRQRYIRACIDSGETTRALEELEGAREAFLEAERAFVLQGFYEELKRALPQNEQIRHSLLSAIEITGGEETSSDEFSLLLGDLETEPAAGEDGTGESVDSVEGLLAGAAEEVQADAGGVSGLPADDPEDFAATEEGDDLEIPLEFLEAAAGESAAPAEEPAEVDIAPGAGESGLELELEIEIDPEEAVAGVELDSKEDALELAPEPAAGRWDGPMEDFAPSGEEMLDLDLGDPPVPEGSTSSGESFPFEDTVDGGEEILDLDMADALEDAPPLRDLRSDLEEVEFYLQQGLWEDAERICRSLLEENPGNQEVLSKVSEIEGRRKASRPTSSAEQLFDLEGELAGEDLSVLEDDMDGFADSQKGIETPIDLEDTESHYNLGIAYKEMGLLDEAVAEFDKAVINPARRVGCLTLKGICLAEKGSFELAEEAFESAMAHLGLSDGERISLLYELGLLYEGWNKPLEALDRFQSAADADLFFRDVGEKVATLRKRLGMDAGEGEGETGPRGDKNRVSYV